MSAQTKQQQLDGTVPPKDHLVAKSDKSDLDAKGEREWFCKVCGARVTQTTDGRGEYGHRTLPASHEHCPHRLSWGDDDD